jgi:NAD(P)-dependent dehydrogenase (short-subunit alcohol dehydrogenase family)
MHLSRGLWKSLAAWMSRSINAGIERRWIPITEPSEEDWDRTIEINIKGVWLRLKYEIQQMLKQGGGGAIVNMASVAGLMGLAGQLRIARANTA